MHDCGINWPQSHLAMAIVIMYSAVGMYVCISGSPTISETRCRGSRVDLSLSSYVYSECTSGPGVPYHDTSMYNEALLDIGDRNVVNLKILSHNASGPGIQCDTNYTDHNQATL